MYVYCSAVSRHVCNSSPDERPNDRNIENTGSQEVSKMKFVSFSKEAVGKNIKSKL